MAAGGTAAELHLEDVRLVAESRPVAYKTRWTDRLGASDGSGEFSMAWAAGVGVRQGWGRAGRPWQLIGGLEALAVRQQANGLNDDGWLLRAELGAAFAVRHDLAITVLPVLGIGRSRALITPGAAAPLDLVGASSEAGIRGGLRWQPSLCLALGVETGWLSTRQSPSGDGATLDLHSQGPWFSLSFTWIPDPLPAALDRR